MWEGITFATSTASSARCGSGAARGEHHNRGGTRMLLLGGRVRWPLATATVDDESAAHEQQPAGEAKDVETPRAS